MNDRPTLPELIAAVRGHLETHVIPALKAGGDPRLYFQTLIAANLLAIAGREIDGGHAHRLATWHELAIWDAQHETYPPADPAAFEAALAARDAALCASIRTGALDDDPALLDALIGRATRGLEIANPRLLLTLITELGVLDTGPTGAQGG